MVYNGALGIGFLCASVSSIDVYVIAHDDDNFVMIPLKGGNSTVSLMIFVAFFVT